MNLEHKKAGLEKKTTSRDEATGRLRVCGYAAVFGNVDSYGDIIEKGAFKKTIKKNRDRIKVCKNHDLGSIESAMAVLEEIKEDDYGLWVQYLVSSAEEDIATKIEEGIIKEMSIGYRTLLSERNEKNNTRILKEVELYEFSLVSYAANPLAQVKSALSVMTTEELKARYDQLNEEKELLFTEYVKRLTN